LAWDASVKSQTCDAPNLEADQVGPLLLHHAPEHLQPLLRGRPNAVDVPRQHREALPCWRDDTPHDGVAVGEGLQLGLWLLALLGLLLLLARLLSVNQRRAGGVLALAIIEEGAEGILALLRRGRHDLRDGCFCPSQLYASVTSVLCRVSAPAPAPLAHRGQKFENER